MPLHDKLPTLLILEIVGVATLLHNFYNGIENIIKQILSSKRTTVPEGSSWHKDLLDIAVKNNIISNNTKDHIDQYLAFRHFLSHSYALDLYPDKMEPLVENASELYDAFKKEISIFS